MKYPMLALLAGLAFAPAALAAEPDVEAAAGVTSQTLLATTKTWDGTPYTTYAKGQPELTVLKIMIPAHTKLSWHEHPMPNAAYILSGDLTILTYGGKTHVVHAGQAVAEVVNKVHRGITGAKPVVLLAFYAGTNGTPVSIPWP
jgi:quercetin dioxygenase-like cupin family protein